MRCSSNASFYVYLAKVHHYKDILRDGLDRILEVELRVPFLSLSMHKGGRRMSNVE